MHSILLNNSSSFCLLGASLLFVCEINARYARIKHRVQHYRKEGVCVCIPHCCLDVHVSCTCTVWNRIVKVHEEWQSSNEKSKKQCLADVTEIVFLFGTNPFSKDENTSKKNTVWRAKTPKIE